MAIREHSVEFATNSRDFYFSNSRANVYCINNHFYYEPHKHGDHFDWIYVAQGRLHQKVNGVDYTLEQGDLLWIRKGDWHEEAGHDMQFFVLGGTTTWLESVMSLMQTMQAYQALLQLPHPPRASVPAQHRVAMEAMWERCWDVHLGSMAPSHAVKLASQLFVDYFLPQVEQVMGHRLVPNWFRKAMGYIQNNVGKEITSEQLAEVCDKSPEHVARCFQTYLGTTPSRYINRTRLNYAARLLTTTNQPILEISMTAGFGSLGHFYRLFKHQFNRSPRSYRLAYQQRKLV